MEHGLELKISHLENCFNKAKEVGANYVGVKIHLGGEFPQDEVIINESENFDAKLAYYKKAYNEDLVHNLVSDIRIVGFTYGVSFSSIEYDLIGEVNE